MKRRSFLLGLSVGIASDLLLPEPCVKVYSFIKRPFLEISMLRIYSGKIPKDADSPLKDNVMLSEIPIQKGRVGWYGTDFSADRSGVASFARIYGPRGNVLMDLHGKSMGLDTNCISQMCTISMRINKIDI